MLLGRVIATAVLATGILATGILAAGPGSGPLAQDAEAEAPIAVEDEIEAAPEVESDLGAAAETAEPEASTDTGALNEAGAFTDWNLECFDEPIEALNCQIAHRVVATDASQVVLVFALAAASEAEAPNVQIALPLGVALQSGIQLVIGTDYQTGIPISRCTPQGCLVEGTMGESLISAMRRGRAGTVVVLNERGDAIQIPFSLMGFTDAFAEMVRRNRG